MKLLEIEGKPVVDAKKSVVLQVTDADVKAGRKKRPNCCAAAQACMRQMKALRAFVHLSRVYVENEKNWVRYMTPRTLRTEIISFDRGGRFERGEYTLAAPRASQKLGQKYRPIKVAGTHPQRGNRMKPTHVAGVRYSAVNSLF